MAVSFDELDECHSKFIRYCNAPPSGQAKLGAVAAALTEQLQNAQTSPRSPSSSEYFAVTLTTLQSPTAESYKLELLKLPALCDTLPWYSRSLHNRGADV